MKSVHHRVQITINGHSEKRFASRIHVELEPSGICEIFAFFQPL